MIGQCTDCGANNVLICEVTTIERIDNNARKIILGMKIFLCDTCLAKLLDKRREETICQTQD